MEIESSHLAVIKLITQHLVTESDGFDDKQVLVTELAAMRIFELFARNLGVKQHLLEWEQLHPYIWSATGETRNRVTMLWTLSWLLLICDSPHEYILEENRFQTDHVAAKAIYEFEKLFQELGLDIPEGIAQVWRDNAG